MIPPTVPPFPFYIINKDIIKGSFPFRKTFLTPKLDFEARFRNPIQTAPRVPPTRRAGTEPRKRNELAAKPDFATRFRPSRVFRRPEEPQQNYGNGTNRKREKVFQSGEHFNPKNILSLLPKASEPNFRHCRPVRQKVRF